MIKFLATLFKVSVYTNLNRYQSKIETHILNFNRSLFLEFRNLVITVSIVVDGLEKDLKSYIAFKSFFLFILRL